MIVYVVEKERVVESFEVRRKNWKKKKKKKTIGFALFVCLAKTTTLKVILFFLFLLAF